MFTYQIAPGTVDVSVVCRAIDSADGTPETAFDHATTGIDLKYRREGAANVDITEASLAALTTGHTDGGVEQIGNGYFRLDLPDLACAAGAPGVVVHGVATGMVIIGCYIQLEGAVNKVYSDTTIIYSDTTIIYSDTTVISSDTTAIHSDTTAVHSDTTAIHTQTTTVASDLVIVASDLLQVYSDTTIIYSDTTLITSKTGSLTFTVAGVVDANMLRINGDDAAAANIEGSAETIVRAAAIAGTLSTTAMTTDLTEATDDHYIGRIIIWRTGVLTGQATDITDYTGATKLLTFTATTEAPSNGDLFVIL